MEGHIYESIKGNVRALEDIRAFEDASRQAADECSEKIASYARNADTLAVVDWLKKESQAHRRLGDWCTKRIREAGRPGGT